MDIALAQAPNECLLDRAMLLAYRAQAIEKHRLHLIVLGALGTFQKRVVGMGKDVFEAGSHVVQLEFSTGLNQETVSKSGLASLR
ncbi:hypothetical protein GCM10009304_27950 [Pseudomonas matsuisoli]|uniref:Uncharacterized protein n=1 Tax=Pseudomonas matsuisoli TaxID=1515666 RepID=A0A917PYW2_9PSED|nr:hypothetical protein GCM10009304_27950 [Pseudomonas matsuisoli]